MNVNQNNEENNVVTYQNYPDNDAVFIHDDIADVVNGLVQRVEQCTTNTNVAGTSDNLQQRINQIENPPSQRHQIQHIAMIKPTVEIYRNTNHQHNRTLIAPHGSISSSGFDLERSVLEPRADLPTVPPSYSTVMKQEHFFRDMRRDVRSMEIQHLSPFRRAPPPSYSEIQNNWSHSSQEFSQSSSEQIIFGPDPVFIWCHRCTTVVVSTTHSERSKFTHFTAAALCLLGCWPCALLPYCMNACKNTYHYCPDCNYLLGMYRPW